MCCLMNIVDFIEFESCLKGKNHESINIKYLSRFISLVEVAVGVKTIYVQFVFSL